MELMAVGMFMVTALVVMLLRSRIVGAWPSPMPVVVVPRPKPLLRSGHEAGRWGPWSMLESSSHPTRRRRSSARPPVRAVVETPITPRRVERQ